MKIRLQNAFLADVVESTRRAEVNPGLTLNSQSRNVSLMPSQVFESPFLTTVRPPFAFPEKVLPP